MSERAPVAIAGRPLAHPHSTPKEPTMPTLTRKRLHRGPSALASLFRANDPLDGAACAGAGLPGSLIPDPCSDSATERAKAARALCPTCPVLSTCATVREGSLFVFAGVDTGEGITFDKRDRPNHRIA